MVDVDDEKLICCTVGLIDGVFTIVCSCKTRLNPTEMLI